MAKGDKDPPKETSSGNGQDDDQTSQQDPNPTPQLNWTLSGNFSISGDNDIVTDGGTVGGTAGGTAGGGFVTKDGVKGGDSFATTGGVNGEDSTNEDKTSLSDKGGFKYDDTSTGVPPKSTTSVNTLEESSSNASLSDREIIFDDKYTSSIKKNETPRLEERVKEEGNYNVSLLRFLDIVVVHYDGQDLPKFVEAFTASPGAGHTPSLKIASNLQGDVDYLILDIIPFVSVPGSPDQQRPRYGGNFLLDPSNPYILSLPKLDEVRFESGSLNQYLSYTPKTNHLRINWRQLSSKGVSELDLKLNFIDRSIEAGITPSISNIFQLSTTEVGASDFQSFTVSVDKSGKEHNHKITCSEPERYDFIPYLNIENPKPLDTSGFNREVTLSLSRNLESKAKINGDYFTRLDIDHNTDFSSLPIMEVEDRGNVVSVSRPVNSKEGALKFYTRTFYDGYVFGGDSLIFHDQFIERRLSHNIVDAKNGYTIFSVNDNLEVLGDSIEISSAGNDIEFRREYAFNELTDEEERRDIKSNYFIYVNRDKAFASSRLNPILNFEIDNRVSENMICSLGYKIVQNEAKAKDNFSIKLVSLTRIGEENNPQVFSKDLSIEWSSSNSFPYGKYTTYGSGDGTESDGFSLRCLCIKDLCDILQSNLYGNINSSNPNGGFDSDTVGFFPTLGELYPNKYPEGSDGHGDPIVKISKTKEYSGHYLLPLSRLWLGNSSGNNYESLSERNIMHVSNYESSDPYASSYARRDNVYCRGLEKTISLEKFTIMTPLARKLGVPGVRSSIKTYDSHLGSGDFELISSGGAGDNRFYKWNTVRDAVDILREGSQFGSVTKGLKSFEYSNMFGRRCSTETYGRGTKRELMGLASLGIPLYYYDDHKPVSGDDGWGKIPSYVISNLFYGDKANPSLLDKYVDKWKASTGEVNFAYGSYSSFDAAGSTDGDLGLAYSMWGSRDNVVDWQEDLYPHGFTSHSGGIWWIVYSTFDESGHNLDENYGKNTREMLDPSLFGPEYQIMFEGGDSVNDSTRRIFPVYVFDIGVDNENLVPNYNHIYNLINSLLQDRVTSGQANSNGGIRWRFGSPYYYLKSNGSYRVRGSGPINYSVSFLRDQSRDPSKIYILEGQDERSINIESFGVIQQMRAIFGTSLIFESSADFDLQDIFPLWESVFPEHIYYPPPEPYGDDPQLPGDPSYPDDPYGDDPYLITVIDPQSDSEISVDPYGTTDVDISVLTGELIYKQIVVLKMGDSVDVLYRKHSLNTSLFEFYLNRGRYRTVHDLSSDINRRLLSKGVRFTNLLSYSRFYTPDRMLATDGNMEIMQVSSLVKNRNGLTLYGGSRGVMGYIQGDYGALSTLSNSIFSLNLFLKKNDTLSSITSIVEDNLIGRTNDELPVGLRRNRFRSDVQSLLKSYVSNRKDQSSMLIAEAKRRSDLTINVGKYGIGSSGADFETPHVAHATAGGEVGIGLQVALGGFVKNGDFILFDSPNTYFEHNYNIFFPLSFAVKDAEMMILLVRIRNEDGSYSPNDGDTLSLYRASISYSNGLLPGSSTGVHQSQVPGADFTEYEENESGDFEEVSPAVLTIPLKAPVNNVLIRNDFYYLETTVKITNSPESLDEFGFLAINRNNFSFNMQESKMTRSFGLVLDFLGAWDILVSPEAIVKRQANGVFNYLGLGYNREALDTDESFMGGVGVSVPDPDNIDIFDQTLNDIFIDTSVLPDEVQGSVRMLPVPGYPKVLVLQIDPGVKGYLEERRAASGGDPNSQEGCFLDIPLFFKGKETGAEGTCSVRVFLDIACVTDYNLCDYFWNLSTPPGLAGQETLSNNLEVSFSDYADCVDESYIDESENIISRHYIDCLMSNVPMLDSGSALVLIKSPKSTLNVSSFFKPPEEVLNRIMYVSGPPESENAPWSLTCDTLTSDEVLKINKPIIYTDPGNLSIYTDSVSEIVDILESNVPFMFVNPQFSLIDEDIKGNCYSDEQIILGVGMSFNNWRIGPDPGFPLKVIIGVELVLPSNVISEFSIPFCVKYLYNEDRKVR